MNWEAVRELPSWLGHSAASAVDRLDTVLGGAARRHVVLVLTAVLGLAIADQGALSATAGAIQDSFGLSKTEFGALGSVTTAVTALATVPFGIYVDRVTRTRLLAGTILVWTAAMVASATATSFVFLLASRALLGAASAVAYPATASLIGDYFPIAERGKIYGYVLSGEFVGTGIGVALASVAASLFGTWRAGMVALAIPALGVAWLARRLPEPARGGASRMPRGQEEILSAERLEQAARQDPGEGGQHESGEESGDEDLAEQQVHDHDVQPDPGRVLRDRSLARGILKPAAYILRVRTNDIIVVASGLGYFFFSGLRFFGIQWAQEHYGINRGAAASLLLVVGVAAVLGVLVGGRVADTLLRRGRVSARVVIPAVTFVSAAALIAPGIGTASVGLALTMILPGAFLFAASNPPLDAARLDVMPFLLWGRAESVRSSIRHALEAVAPITFGFLAGNVLGGPDEGLTRTFQVMLVPLVLAGAVLLLALRSYPRDVATASASDESLAELSKAEAARERPGRRP